MTPADPVTVVEALSPNKLGGEDPEAAVGDPPLPSMLRADSETAVEDPQLLSMLPAESELAVKDPPLLKLLTAYCLRENHSLPMTPAEPVTVVEMISPRKLPSDPRMLLANLEPSAEVTPTLLCKVGADPESVSREPPL